MELLLLLLLLLLRIMIVLKRYPSHADVVADIDIVFIDVVVFGAAVVLVVVCVVDLW